MQKCRMSLIAVLALGFCSSSALANRACCFPDGTCEMFRTIEEHNEFCLPFGGETQGSGVTCEDDPPPCGFCGDGILSAGEECDDGNNVDGDGCSADCTSEDGCTPGFWKQVQHLPLWTGFAPGDIFSDVFGVGPAITLFEAVNLHGGGENRLMAHAVAAILNVSNPDVDYNLTLDEIVALVQDAFATGDFNTAKDIFVTENERGCPVG